MNPPQTSPRAPGRRISWFVWLGVALLAVSVLGASKGLQSPGDPAAGPASSSSELRPGGFGFVDTEAGVVPLYRPGEVVEVLAHDGDEVDKDAPLYRLNDTLAQIDLNRAKLAVKDAEAQLAIAESKADQQKALIEAQNKVVEGKGSRVRIAQAQAAKAKRLNDGGNAGLEDVQQAEDAVKAFQAEVDAEKARGVALERQATELQAHVRRAQTDIDDRKEQVRKAQEGVNLCTVKAPVKGKVMRVFVAVGDTLGTTPRHPGLEFLATGKEHPFIIRAEIDQEFATRVFKGQAAEFQDDTRISQTWTGKVKRVSDWYAHRRSIRQEPLQFNDVRTLEVIVALDDPPPALKIGQRVRVTLK
jgi:multidrug resistance efflux pump